MRGQEDHVTDETVQPVYRATLQLWTQATSLDPAHAHAIWPMYV